jgi:beta-galactosidase
MNVAAIVYTARSGNRNGNVKDYEIYLSDKSDDWGAPAVKGRFQKESVEQTVRLSKPVKARFMKFVAISEQQGQAFASVADLDVVEAKEK